MTWSRLVSLGILGVAVMAGIESSASGNPPAEGGGARLALHAAYRLGNYKTAYEGLRPLILAADADPSNVGSDLPVAIDCLQRLNRTAEVDDLLESAAKAHAKQWRVLAAVARAYNAAAHFGFQVAGKFQRGPHRGGGQQLFVGERDRVRALQLLVQAMPLVRGESQHGDVASFFRTVAQTILEYRSGNAAWRLQLLTDLTTLPEFDDPMSGADREPQGAPVGAEGKPIFYTVPASFDKAQNDGQRWRWCLAQVVEFDPQQRPHVELERAEFLQSQFGVETLAQFGIFFGGEDADDAQSTTGGIFALHTLGDDETIARLANGVKRFKLPDEFNPLRILSQLAADNSPLRREVSRRLATIYQNRRQYPQSAAWWRQCVALSRGQERTEAQRQLDQIVGNWGRFESAPNQPAGTGATVDFRFRNARSVKFTAQRIDVDKLLGDLKAYLKSNPQQLDWSKVDIGDVGNRLVQQNQRQYLGAQVAQWTMALQPRENHFDKRITITTPLQQAGAYLLRADVEGGNSIYVVLWVTDTVIVKKPLGGKTYYFVADAVSGAPLAKANVEFFGWRQEHRQGRLFELQTQQSAEFTDAQGQVIVPGGEDQNRFQWLITARTPQGRLAILGFTHIWTGNYYDAQYNQVKVYTITDRPVYRPAQKVHYKFWVRRARYDMPNDNEFAGRTFEIELHNPKGERIVTRSIAADSYGGLEGEYDLPADAPLGVYQLLVKNHGGGSFRVEEYKKPEFEVTVDAPREPVQLGETFQAKITAKYYFGAPVTKALVKYKVTRSAYTERWYPVGPWDWLYGRGYWWFADDYPWYPGWRHWGCPRPIAFWWPRFGYQPPEVITQREVEIGDDGTVSVEVDSALAKALHGDEDHQYTITAEVVDASRRTIVGSGSVLAARRPFTVTGWVDRGYYRVGDTVRAHFAARTLDGQPVTGKGTLQLLQVTYKDGKPEETVVQKWDLPTDAEGQALQQLVAAQAGQYRLSYKVTDARGRVIEGGYLLTVTGPGFDGADFRFNHLEIVPQQREYRPGDKVRLLINTDKPGGTVLLFVRPANGIYLPPQQLQIKGKSTVHEIDVVAKDMPNFFVEALTVADGRVHTQLKEIVVPPEQRVLQVDVMPSAENYRPGQKATAKLKLTDPQGKPVVGTTVVSIYDKSVEYISGGSNVPEIKEFFWKWRRQHHPQTETSLTRAGYNIDLPNKPGLENLGLFGHIEQQEQEAAMGGVGGGMGGMPRGRMGGMLMKSAMPASAAAPMMMADSAALAAPAPAAARDESFALTQNQAGAANGAAGPGLVEPTVRSQFADTALWVGALETAADGTADISLAMPENLTTWRIKAWAISGGTRVGQGSVDVVTRKDLIVRLQAPRFFVERDEVVLSAVVHNYLKSGKDVRVVLDLPGKELVPLAGVELQRSVNVPAGGESRVDWRVRVAAEGNALIRMKALTDEESDAMEQRFPCYVHGILKTDSYSGALRPETPAGQFTVNVPAERRPEQSRLEVRFSPTLAGALVDALPYLADYPYGCTEQTLNRFLPTVITQKVLIEMGLDLEQIKNKRTNLNAQEIGDAAARAAQWNRPRHNPVFDRAEVDRMVKAGLSRLVEMQLSDGGWGWFSGWGEHSSAHTTATVVHGLQIAQQNDVALVPGVLERGVAWLKKYQDEQVDLLKKGLLTPKPQRYRTQADNLDALVYMVLVDAGQTNAEMLKFLDRDRTHLAVYGLALFGTALQKQGEKEKLAVVMENIRQYVVEDNQNQTAWLNIGQNSYWWYWYGSEFEAHAYYLKLLSRTDPKGELPARLAKYLINNRKHATYWNSTRDTALCIEALAEFLRASGEAKSEMTVGVLLDGKLLKAVEITPQTLFTIDNVVVVEGAPLTPGKHTVEIRRTGKGPLYYNGYMTNFTTEDFITKAGLEIQVQRKYYLLEETTAKVAAAGSHGQATQQQVEKFRRHPLENLATLTSGQLVEVELEIDSKNDYEYLMFEDMKPAGFEPVDVRSGYTGNALGAYVEFRDNRVVFFVSHLARGKHSVAYRMRAEIPGRFSALPAQGAGMYAPELKANSDEIKVQVKDK